MRALGDSFKNIPKPNLSAAIKEFQKLEDAATDAWEATQKIGEGMAGGQKGSGGKSGLGKKASGGWTVPGQLTLVGEEGPELLTTSRPMYVTPHSQLGGVEIDYERLAALIRGGGDTINYHGLTYEEATARDEQRRREERTLYGRIGR